MWGIPTAGEQALGIAGCLPTHPPAEAHGASSSEISHHASTLQSTLLVPLGGLEAQRETPRGGGVPPPAQAHFAGVNSFMPPLTILNMFKFYWNLKRIITSNHYYKN